MSACYHVDIHVTASTLPGSLETAHSFMGMKKLVKYKLLLSNLLLHGMQRDCMHVPHQCAEQSRGHCTSAPSGAFFHLGIENNDDLCYYIIN